VKLVFFLFFFFLDAETVCHNILLFEIPCVGRQFPIGTYCKVTDEAV
jgi:hypothetical protein